MFNLFFGSFDYQTTASEIIYVCVFYSQIIENLKDASFPDIICIDFKIFPETVFSFSPKLYISIFMNRYNTVLN